jgi:hypothetical protein
VPPTHDGGWDVLVGDLEDRSYLIDPSFILSGSEPDLLAAIAAESGKLVMGFGGETVSGTFYCFIARGPEILRHYFHCHSALAQPYSFGGPLPNETPGSFEDLYGAGFLGQATRLGFNYDKWSAIGSKRRFTWTADYLFQKGPSPCSGPLSDAVRNHDEANRLKPEDRPSLKIRVTQGGKVTELDTGIRLDGTRTKKPWWRFWR